MRTATLLIDSYVRDGEAFHFARKHLPTAAPRILHTHDYYETFWIEDGEGAHWINGVKSDLGPGELVFVRPSDTHGFQSRGTPPLRLVNVSFFARSAAHLIDRYGPELLLGTGSVAAGAPAGRGPVQHARAAGPRPGDRPAGPGADRELPVEPHDPRVGPADGRRRHGAAWLAQACQASREPAVFRHGARGLVAAARRSHEHVCRAMRRHLATSPSAYVNAIRMEHAARLLGGSDESISNIALDCALENLSHFYRMFRGHYGMTPRAYRRRHQVDIVQPA